MKWSERFTIFIVLWLVIFVGIIIAISNMDGDETSTQIPATLPWTAPEESIAVTFNTIVAKMVDYPTDPVRDFIVIHLDGEYTVHYDPELCFDHDPHLYGPFHSSHHCTILEPDITNLLIADQSWLDDQLLPLRPFLQCVNGWIYRVDGTTDDADEQVWILEMLGIPAFCKLQE